MLGERIKQIRKGKTLTQQAFASMLDTSSGYISEIEAGKKVPGGEFLLLLKREFDIDLNWLLTGEGEMNPLQAYSVAEGQAEFRVKGRSEGKDKVLDSRTAAVVSYFEALGEDDKKAFEQIAATLAQSAQRLKKTG